MPDKYTTREALSLIRDAIPGDAVVVTSLGRTAVEAASVFPASLRLDAMGCVIPLAAGVAIGLERQRVIALDTDGSALLELSAFAVLPRVFELVGDRLRIVVFDNAILEAGGGMARAPRRVDWTALFGSFGLGAQTLCGASKRAVEDALRANEVLVIPIDNTGADRPLPPVEMTGRELAVAFRRTLAHATGRAISPPAVKP